MFVQEDWRQDVVRPADLHLSETAARRAGAVGRGRDGRRIIGHAVIADEDLPGDQVAVLPNVVGYASQTDDTPLGTTTRRVGQAPDAEHHPRDVSVV